jgi:hypothetical protein
LVCSGRFGAAADKAVDVSDTYHLSLRVSRPPAAKIDNPPLRKWRHGSSIASLTLYGLDVVACTTLGEDCKRDAKESDISQMDMYFSVFGVGPLVWRFRRSFILQILAADLSLVAAVANQVPVCIFGWDFGHFLGRIA